MPYFPVFMDLTDKTVLIAGGWKYAERRVRTLLSFARKVIVVSDGFSESMDIFLRTMEGDERLCVRRRAYETGDLDGVFMVFAATRDKELNARIMEECRERGILGNAIFDKPHSGFIFPGLVYREPFVIGFAAGGEAHRMVRELRARTELIVEEMLGRLRLS